MSGREYDRNQPVRPLAPIALARLRAERFEDPLDQDHFLIWFDRGRVAAVREDPRLYQWYRTFLDLDDSVAVAGLIEGISSTRTEGLVI